MLIFYSKCFFVFHIDDRKILLTWSPDPGRAGAAL